VLTPITIAYPIRPKRRSLACNQVADLFGLSLDEPPAVIAQNLELPIEPGDRVLFTGPSGSGKSSIMNAAARQLGAVDAMALTLPETPIVEALNGPLADRLSLLSSCGLSEARLLLRSPAELSEGQRYRFRIAYALNRNAPAIALDEFTATLDRTLAKVVAFNLRKLKTDATILMATTHEDLVEDLQPDVHVICRGDGNIAVERRTVKKKPSASPAIFGSAKAPQPTGRTSLGGITAACISLSRGKSSSSGTAKSRSASAPSPHRPRA
jgi:ABC-type ATPase with predicted acetyltransferase domain